jgi:hypothetical protein
MVGQSPAAPAASGPAVDVVYTWVNGNDPGYQELCRRYGRVGSDLNPERYRDLYSMFKYSLRSVARYVHWVRDVYLFTCRPQAPDWLNLDHPRLHLVHHDEVFEPQYLPTFNSNAIESYLHAIPNPSDYLLYMNDDFLFGRETGRDDFLDQAGRIKVYGTLLGEHHHSWIYDRKDHVKSMAFVEHTPLLLYKPFWREMLELEPEKVGRTRANRFRQRDDLRMDKLYRYYLLSRRRRQASVVPAFSLLRYHQLHKITNDFARQRDQLAKLKRKNPKFFCLNDDQRDNPDPAVVGLFRAFLETHYPDKSPYER